MRGGMEDTRWKILKMKIVFPGEFGRARWKLYVRDTIEDGLEKRVQLRTKQAKDRGTKAEPRGLSSTYRGRAEIPPAVQRYCPKIRTGRQATPSTNKHVTAHDFPCFRAE